MAPRQNSYKVTEAAKAHNHNPNIAKGWRIPVITTITGAAREIRKGFQAAFPRVLAVECFQAERGAIPIRSSNPANSGPVMRSYHSGPKVTFCPVTISEIRG